MLFDYDQKFLWNNFINHEDDNYFGEEVRPDCPTMKQQNYEGRGRVGWAVVG